MRKTLPLLSLSACLLGTPITGCLDAEPSGTLSLSDPGFPSSAESTPDATADVAMGEKAAEAAPRDGASHARAASKDKQGRSASHSSPKQDAPSAANSASPPPSHVAGKSKASVLGNIKSVRTPGAAAYKVAALSGARGRGNGGGGVSRSSISNRVSYDSAPSTKASRKMAPKKMKRRALATTSGMAAPGQARRPMPKRPMPLVSQAPAEPMYADQDEGGTFQHAGTNPFTETLEDKLSTFSIDVDTASYTYARRFLKAGNRPNASSVRVEEWVNAFHYEYASPSGRHPFGIHMEAGPSPLSEGKHLLRVGIQGKRVSAKNRKPVHLTFLVDTSGSMRRNDKLPLAQRALHHLVDNLSTKDSVALITYAGSTSEVLPQTSARHKQRIHKAIDSLMAGGGTAMGSGMQMAYRNAGKFVAPGSVSRVIVLSDGDANIGRTRHGDILKSIKGYVSEGIKLSTVGFGTGNYKDHLMEQLADAGDGNYSYIDSFAAAKRTFGTDLSGTLQVIAKDVKIQVEMNPRVVKRYRLLGYENRDIADKDFRNDKVDAGEIGAGHSVTALYEVELQNPYDDVSEDVATVRVRYKKPRGLKATEVARTFTDSHVRKRFGDLSRDTRWAAAVSVASEVLRGSPYARDKTLEDAWSLAAEAAGGKYASERREFIDLLDRTVKRGAVASR